MFKEGNNINFTVYMFTDQKDQETHEMTFTFETQWDTENTSSRRTADVCLINVVGRRGVFDAIRRTNPRVIGSFVEVFCAHHKVSCGHLIRSKAVQWVNH